MQAAGLALLLAFACGCSDPDRSDPPAEQGAGASEESLAQEPGRAEPSNAALARIVEPWTGDLDRLRPFGPILKEKQSIVASVVLNQYCL